MADGAASSAMTLEQQRREIASHVEVGANQRLFFENYSRQKRGPPTPVASSLATPQEAESGATTCVSGQPELVATRELEDHTALQVTAGAMGHDVNNPQAVENFLNAPVHTAREVLQLVRGYHKAVIRPELYGAVVQLESAMKALHDRIFVTQSELRFMASD